MDKFIIDSIEKNQKEIDDLLKDDILDKEFKGKLLDTLNQEKDMLMKLKDSYDSKKDN